MWEALCYGPGICWIVSIIFTVHLGWGTILLARSKFLLLKKKKKKRQRKPWNSEKRFNLGTWGEGGSWIIQRGSGKHVSCRDCPSRCHLWQQTWPARFPQEKFQVSHWASLPSSLHPQWSRGDFICIGFPGVVYPGYSLLMRLASFAKRIR